MTDVRSLENLSGEILVPLVSRGCCYEEEEAIVALLIVLCWMHVRPGKRKGSSAVPAEPQGSQETLVLQLCLPEAVFRRQPRPRQQFTSTSTLDGCAWNGPSRQDRWCYGVCLMRFTSPRQS